MVFKVFIVNSLRHVYKSVNLVTLKNTQVFSKQLHKSNLVHFKMVVSRESV